MIDLKASLDAFLLPLLPFFSMPDVTDIEINPDGSVWIHRLSGTMEHPPEIMLSGTTIRSAALLLASFTASTDASEKSPSICTTYPGTTIRIQIWLPPVVSSPSLSIRIPHETQLTLADMVANGTLTAVQAQRLTDAVKGKRTIIVSGETGSGKTTLASALVDLIPHDERAIIIEDVHELRCTAPNCLPLLYQPAGPYTCRRAIADALHGNPNRIIIGEVRDGAALDLLKAWNTGHSGVCTVHANGASSVPDRLNALVQESSASPQPELIRQAVDMVVHMAITQGKRYVAEIKEFKGI